MLAQDNDRRPQAANGGSASGTVEAEFNSNPRASTLADVVRMRGTAAPDRVGFTFLTYRSGAEPEAEDLTYGELLKRAEAIAAALKESCNTGDRVLILCPPGLDYISAFFGCQVAGMVAVPAYPPRNARHMGRLQAILDDAGATAILASADLADRLVDWASATYEPPPIVLVDRVEQAAGGALGLPVIDPGDLAFLQYTSGTTGRPKGVMVSHRQAIENVHQVARLCGLGHDTVGTLWLPPYHDMGLVGGLLVPLAMGFPNILMSPASFLQRPVRWLNALSHFSATITSAPNFGWQLCADEVSDEVIGTLDFSSLRHALSGAEPVRHETLQAFAGRFRGCGFRPEQFVPVYGMAETVLLATGTVRREPPPALIVDQQALSSGHLEILGKVAAGERHELEPDQSTGNGPIAVSCGRAIENHDLKIADPETCRECPAEAVGEVWISGPSVAAGYWGKPEETEATFRARLANDPDSGPWLRTGDLGAVIDGELYVLGRIKEMVIVRGRNHYAQDLEATAAASDPVLGRDRTIAFGIEEGGEERVVLVHELTRSSLRSLDARPVAASMRRAVLEAHEIDVSAIVFVKPAHLPRTTSGKLQRGRARDLFLAGELATVAEWRAASNAVTVHDVSLVRRWAKTTDLPSPDEAAALARQTPGVSDAAAAYRPEADGTLTVDLLVVPDAGAPATIGRAKEGDGRMRFGLFFFGSDDPTAGDEPRYDLLLKAAEEADSAGLEAIWTPERHFGVFGGQYPSPVATSAALAGRTKHIAIRAGSVVMPLNHPIRVAEDWAVIDNLSGGRVGVSFASGWHARDFVLMPGAHGERRARMMEGIETVRRLWRGEELTFSNGDETFSIAIRPRPIQEEIPVWLTAAGSPETFREAGARGLNLLTFMAQTSPEALADKIGVYRDAALARDPDGQPRTTVMVHTFLAASSDEARGKVEGPMRRYVRDAMRLAEGAGVGEAALAGAAEAMVDNAVRQFLATRGLFCSPAEALERVTAWQALGMDEIACLVDFGLPAEEVLSHLRYLFELDALCRRTAKGHPARFERDLAARVVACVKHAMPDMAIHVHVARETDGQALSARIPALVPVSVASGTPPRTADEHIVAQAFAAVLEQEDIYRETSFFDRGGHSLMVARLVALLEQETGLSIPISVVFEAPTVAGLAAALEDTGAAGDLGYAPLVPSQEVANAPFPLTDLQTAYYLGRQGGGVLGDVSCFTFVGLSFPELDVTRLEGALDRLVAAHPMLRAVLAPDLTQRILPEVPAVTVPVTDLSQRTATEAEAAWSELVARLSHQVRPAERWPLFDVHAVKMPDEAWRLTFGIDLLIGDAVSLVLIAQQLFGLYFGTSGELRAPSLTFRDVVLHSVAHRESTRFRKAEAYWRGRLADLPDAPALPLAVSPSELGRTVFERRSFRIEAKTWDQVKVRASAARLTPVSVMLTAYATVLAMWSRSDDFIVNLTVMDRKPLHEEMDAIVGDFTAIELLEVRGARQGTFGQRAAKLQQRYVEDLEHLDFSGVEVWRALAAESGRSPGEAHVVFTSLLGTAGVEDALSVASDHGVEVMTSTSQTPQVLIDCQVSEGRGGLVVNWDTPSGLFADGLLDDMFAAYQGLVERLAGSDEAWQAEGVQTLPDWQRDVIACANATAGPLPTGRLQDRVFAQAQLRPQAPAVLGLDGAPDGTLTFGMLSACALTLASDLRSDLGSDDRLIAVAMDKGWQQVVSALAVLETGVALLPVSLEQPDERIGQILSDAGARLVLTTPSSSERLSALPGIEIVVVSEVSVSGTPVPERRATRAATPSPEDLAYVIYTSGSTGRPKGVMINHRAALNTLLDLEERFALGPDDRVLWVSDLSFDLSIFDLFGVLGAGGAVVLPAAGSREEPRLWVEAVARHQVTVWNSVPQLAEMAVTAAEGQRSDESTGLGSLRLMMLSGDWIPVSLPDRVRALAPDCAVKSLGGATEASIWSILYPIEAVDPAWVSIPYGKPLRNQTFHVLRDDLSPCPVHAPGTLFIGGIGLADGYFGDAEKTAERFITHPKNGERLYDTGDLGRYLPSGDIVFLGREDFQVKIRGFRVELGEIDAALMEHPSVAAAVTTAVGDRDDRRIIAYVVPKPVADARNSVDPEIIQSSDPLGARNWLADRLPPHMVPTAVAVLDRLPLTPSGKIDRKALPDVDGLVVQAAYVAPRTETEARVAATFADLLGVERVGAEESFFDLGGNSLLAVRLVARLEAETGRTLPVRTVFEAPTVAGLAAVLDDAEAGPASVEPITVADRSRPLPLSFQQERFWLLDRPDAGAGSAYHVEGALRLSGPLDVSALSRALSDVVTRHESLRTVFAEVDGCVVQTIRSVEENGFALVDDDFTGLDDAAVSARVEGLMSAPFDLAEGPLFRAALLRIGPHEHVLVVGGHHAVLDGWSVGLLFEEISELYRARKTGTEANLPAASIQYADYGAWQREFVSGCQIDDDLKYWRDQLAGIPDSMSLPFDGPRPETRDYQGAAVPVTVERNLTAGLNSLATQCNASLFMVLQTALAALLAHLGDDRDVVILSAVANRHTPALDRVVGAFVNDVAIRHRVDPEQSFGEQLAETRQTVLQAFGHSKVPFMLVEREIRAAVPGKHAPIGQVALNLHNWRNANSLSRSEFAGLSTRPFSVDALAAAFDLSLSLYENDNGLGGRLKFAAQLFDKPTIEQLVLSYVNLLQAAVEAPDASLRALLQENCSLKPPSRG